MKYIESILSQIYQSKEDYIKECKMCFLKETKETQFEIQQADTDELLDELKNHNWTTAFEDYCKAIKYELMLRGDFQDEF